MSLPSPVPKGEGPGVPLARLGKVVETEATSQASSNNIVIRCIEIILFIILNSPGKG